MDFYPTDYNDLKPHEKWLRKINKNFQLSENERIIRMIKFTREELLDNEIPWLPAGDKQGGFTIIERCVTGRGRWGTDWATVFSYEDKLYRLCFQTPATEMQDCDEFYGSEPDCVEVFPQEVTITKYFTQSELDKS